MSMTHHPLSRIASYLLIYLTALQPLHPAVAAGMAAATGQTQIKNQGQVPVINIATPNGAGISHNTYKEFNVAAPGAVLNNAVTAGKSQLAGQVAANPNLKNKKAAQLIINEVTGSGRSQLQGKLEVFGSRAAVIVANPNGITCDGCGFINTPNVTLTTGKPLLDKQGRLEALEVKKGSVIIGGKGLDGQAQDYVDIISRATELNGKINAKNLTLTQGANRINFSNGTMKPITGEGAKPQLAVDTKALGGMYANKIRLIANENGVGVNLKDVTSTQGDILLSASGKVTLNNISAKNDLNLSARETAIAAGVKVSSGRDITLASTALNNQGSVVAGRDMRVFGDTVRNSGSKALLQANDNLWIQKDALGNKGKLLENKSATIKTTKGDLIVRTEKLENIREKLEVKIQDFYPTESIKKGIDDKKFLSTEISNNLYFGLFFNFKDEYPKKWFGEIDSYSLHMGLPSGLNVNVNRKEFSLSSFNPEAIISSGGSIYANADSINNISSKVESTKDIILTGVQLKNQSLVSGVLNGFDNFKITGKEPVQGDCLITCYLSTVNLVEKKKSWETKTIYAGQLNAGRNLVADFKDAIHLNTPLPYDAKIDEVTLSNRSDTLSAKNILLHAGTIGSTDVIRAAENLTLLADDRINLDQSVLSAGNQLSMTAVNNIDAGQSDIKGKDITVVSRTGEIKFHTSDKPHYFHPDGTRWMGSLVASNHLDISAGTHLLLRDTVLGKSRSILLNAGKDIGVVNTDSFLSQDRLGTPATLPALTAAALTTTGRLSASESITLNAGGALNLLGGYIQGGKDVSLLAGSDILLNHRVLPAAWDDLLPSSRQSEVVSSITAGGNLLTSAGRDIGARAARLSATGNATLLAGRHLALPALAYSAIDSNNDNNKDDRHLVASLKAGKVLSVAANGDWTAEAATFTSGGNMTLSSGGKMAYSAVKNHTYREGNNEYTENTVWQPSVLNGGGVLTLLSNSSILFQATKLTAKGAMDVAAKGGFLYAQAMEESSHYEKKTVKRKWYGKKTTIKQTKSTVINRVTEFSAGGNIHLLSRDDSTYQASKINAGKHATLTSTQGKVIFEAVKNTTFEQRITNSKGFYIKNADKGYTQDTWRLPAIYTGGKLTVDAAKGISADVKTQNNLALKNTVLALGSKAETAWLKGLDGRKDVQWNSVRDAYDSWNYKSQHLNPVVSAVIAIAVAAVTAGAGLAAAAGSNAVSITGATGMTATAVHGAASAGMMALTSQAAVALVDNRGNLSKTLQVMGSSESVKSLATSMVVGGALAGFDSIMKFNVDPSKTNMPMLSNGEWGKVAQRIAGHSVISSSLGTAINGGSFKDQLTTALLSNIGNQINAEGVNLISREGYVVNVPGKAVSYAAISALAAEIGGGDAKGAAAGALAAELATIVMDQTFTDFKSRYQNEDKIRAAAKFIGGLSGAIFTNSAQGANSGANAAEIVVENNYLSQGMRQYGMSQSSLGAQMLEDGAGIDQISEALVKAAKGSMPEGQNAVKGLLTAWGEFFGVPVSALTANGEMTPAKAAEIMASGVPASEAKLVQYVLAKAVLTVAKSSDLGLAASNQKYVDILSPEAKQHILYGDSLTSGGHLYPGNPGKTVFPQNWSADKVVHAVGDIATSPNTIWYAQTGTGGTYTGKGKPANWVSYEIRDGVRIRVVYQPATGKIITAFPDNAPIPSSYKKTK